MRTNFAEHYCSKLQNDMYASVNDASESRPFIGRLASLPVSIIDVVIEFSKTPLNSIEGLMFGIFNFIGSIFSEKYNLKDSLFNTEKGLHSFVSIPVVAFIAPFKLVYQFFSILINPDTASSINYNAHRSSNPIFGR